MIDNRSSQAEVIGPGIQSVISLLLVIHLSCVFISLFGNESASVLRNRLVAVLAPYTRTLNLDPEFIAGFHLTHAMEFEDDHQLVIVPDGAAEPILYPANDRDGLNPWLGYREHRWRMLAQRLGVLASEEDDDAVAELARAIGESAFEESEARHLVFRCRRLRPAELTTSVDYALDDPATFEILYSADVIADTQGVVRVHKQIAADEAAPVRGE